MIKKKTVSFSTIPSDYNFDLVKAIKCSGGNSEILHPSADVPEINVLSVHLLEIFRCARQISFGLMRNADLIPDAMPLFIADLEGFEGTEMPFYGEIGLAHFHKAVAQQISAIKKAPGSIIWRNQRR